MAAGAPDPPAPQRPPEERYGILALARMRKDDGRSLILYRLAESDCEGADAGDAHLGGDGEAP
jgi:hypothetical protein